MEKELINAIKNSTLRPEENISSLVWNKILKRERALIKIKLLLFSSLGALSVIGFFPVFKILLGDLSKSGFYEYISIAFSSNGIFENYWKELLLSITETLPVASILYTLITLFIFFLSLKYLIKQITQSRLGIDYNFNY